MHLGRNSVGYETNADFMPTIKEKLCEDGMVKNRNADVIFSQDNVCNYSYETLPYLFHDPHSMDKKVDVKKLQFGSKIDKTEPIRNELFTVKEVISPNKILLNNGLAVCLLGVLVKQDGYFKAIEYLKQKFNKRRVFLK